MSKLTKGSDSNQIYNIKLEQIRLKNSIRELDQKIDELCDTLVDVLSLLKDNCSLSPNEVAQEIKNIGGRK